MIKKNKISIIFIFIFIFISFIPSANAEVSYIQDNGIGNSDTNVNGIKTIHLHNNGGKYNDGRTNYTVQTINSSEENHQTYFIPEASNGWLPYDITKFEINLENQQLTLEGYAYIHNNNNWGGVYTIISVGVGVDGNYPSDFYEVDRYTDQDIFGWHCNSDENDSCLKGRYQPSNTTVNESLDAQGKAGCYYSVTNQESKPYGCIYKNIGFVTNVDLSNYMNNYQYKNINFYIMVSVVKTYSANNDSYNNSLLIGSDKPHGNPDYSVYKFDRVTDSRYNGQLRSRFIKIGVEPKLCKINPGNKDCNIKIGEEYRETQYLDNGYEIIIGEMSDRVKLAASGKLYCQNSIGNSISPAINVNSKPDYLTYNSENDVYPTAFSSYWRKKAGVRIINITGSSNGADICTNNYVPTTWVVQARELNVMFGGAKTCQPLNAEKNLTCKHPGENFDIEFDDPNQECEQTFKSNSNKSTALVKFTQHGALNVELSNFKIKSGNPFVLTADYVNTVTWKIEKISISDTITDNAQIEAEKESLREKINKYYKESELFKKSKAEFDFCEPGQATLDYNNTCSKKRNIVGNWKRPTAEDLISASEMSENAEGSKTVTATYELTNAWINLDYMANSTKNNIEQKAHIYSETSPEINGYINRKRFYYTYLDEDEGYHKILGYIKGLSALNYENFEDNANDEYIWQATYICGVECYQGFFKNDPGTPLVGNGRGLQLSYREINHLEPFPVRPGATNINNLKEYYKGIDENWIVWANIIGSKELGKTNPNEAQEAGLNTIINRIKSTYIKDGQNKTPDYIITVSKDGVKKLKSLEKNIAENYINDFGYIKDNNGKYAYSNFLETYATQSQEMGMTMVRRSDIVVNEIGTCGENRHLAETESTATCFCPLADSDGTCVYKGDIKGAGW